MDTKKTRDINSTNFNASIVSFENLETAKKWEVENRPKVSQLFKVFAWPNAEGFIHAYAYHRDDPKEQNRYVLTGHDSVGNPLWTMLDWDKPTILAPRIINDEGGIFTITLSPTSYEHKLTKEERVIADRILTESLGAVANRLEKIN